MTSSKNWQTTQIAIEAVQEFVAWSSLSFVVTSIFALPAAIVLLLFFANSGGYFLIGLTMLSIKFASSVVNDDGNSDSTFPDTSDLTRNQTLLLTVVMYTITASIVSSVLIVSSTIAGVLGYMFHFPLAAVIFAAAYPWLDSELSHIFPSLSIGRLAVVVSSALLTAIVKIYGISTDAIDQTAEGELHIY